MTVLRLFLSNKTPQLFDVLVPRPRFDGEIFGEEGISFFYKALEVVF